MSSGWHRKANTPAEQARRLKYQGAEHRAARKAGVALVARGEGRCWRCGCQLYPGRWHVGHDDIHVDVIRGPECIPCNRGAATRKGNRISNARQKASRPGWWIKRPPSPPLPW